MSSHESSVLTGGSSVFINDLNLLSDSGFSYKRLDGKVEYAASAQEAIARCPVLGRYATEEPDQLSIIFQMAAEGRTILDNKANIELSEPKFEQKPENIKKPVNKDEEFVEEIQPDQGEELAMDDTLYEEELYDLDIEPHTSSLETDDPTHVEVNLDVPSQDFKSEVHLVDTADDFEVEMNSPVGAALIAPKDQTLVDVTDINRLPSEAVEEVMIVDAKFPEPVIVVEQEQPVEMHDIHINKNGAVTSSQEELFSVARSTP